MPVIKVKHVVSFSSEDKRFPAENLLKPEGTAKWKCAGVGEKSVSAILQLEKATCIHQIDIGNEGSAFIEVLVGRSSQREEEYQVLLVASSFMNPMESRNSTNPTRVRIFSEDKLSKAAIGEKWDRIRVVCTQPFNKTIQYGLSFIKFHSPPAEGEEKEKPSVQKQATLGAFKLKADSEDSGISAGSLFAQKKEQKTEPAPLTGAAAVRAASKVAAAEARAVPSPSPRPATPQSQPSRPRTPQEPSPSTGIKRKHSTESKESRLQTPIRKQSSDSSVTSTSSSRKGEPPIKKSRSESSSAGPEKPLNRIMEKVVFALSGFQNPRRGQIRDRALDMGAQYKGDWDRTCTHLICAFPNTPKYQQVAGEGKIVTKEWIKECYQRKRLLPWRKYRLGDAETPPGSSDESSDDERPRKTPSKPAPKKEATQSRPKKQSRDYDGSTDDGGDTDDEIQRAREQQAARKPSPAPPPKPAAAASDPYGASTDEEDNDDVNDTMEKNGISPGSDEDGDLPPLPDFFKQKGFFLYGSFPAAERRKLFRYITAYNGSLEEYMDDKVNFVVTKSEWDDNFDSALSDNPSLMFVKPDWVYSCHDKQKLQPFQKYVVMPQS